MYWGKTQNKQVRTYLLLVVLLPRNTKMYHNAIWVDFEGLRVLECYWIVYDNTVTRNY